MGIQQNIENLKGQAKEKIGQKTGNTDLENEGKADQINAEAKQRVDDAANKLSDGMDAVKDKLNKKD